jgi:hypothetical protein
MEITVSEQKIFQVPAVLTLDQARERAWDHKMVAFGVFSRLFLRPRGEEIKVASMQQRFDPVWHLTAHKHLVFHRSREYRVPVADKVVRRVTIAGADHDIAPGSSPQFTIRGVEHCEEDVRAEILVDGMKGTEVHPSAFVRAPREEILNLAEFAPPEATVVPPEVKASTVVQRLIQKLMTSYEADQIEEESIEIEALHLLYRPVFVFQYLWEAKGKQGVVELDAVSGEAAAGDWNFNQQIRQIGRVFNPEMLFDLGAETASLIVPGAGIAFKIGKVLDRQRRQQKPT